MFFVTFFTPPFPPLNFQRHYCHSNGSLTKVTVKIFRAKISIPPQRTQMHSNEYIVTNQRQLSKCGNMFDASKNNDNSSRIFTFQGNNCGKSLCKQPSFLMQIAFVSGFSIYTLYSLVYFCHLFACGMRDILSSCVDHKFHGFVVWESIIASFETACYT